MAIAEYDLTSSMTAVVQVDLSLSFTKEQLQSAQYQPSPDDMLAVFADGKCLGVGEKNEAGWYIYIASPTDKTPSTIVLRYYSASLKNIFMGGESITYQNDTHFGTVDNPYKPIFVVDQK